MDDHRFTGAKVAVAATFALAVALVAMSVFDLDWLGFAVMGMLVVAGLAGQMAHYGLRVGVLLLLLIVGVIGVAALASVSL